MKKSLKTSLKIFFAVTIMLSTNTVYASETLSAEQDEYINHILPRYLEVGNISFNNIKISEAINLTDINADINNEAIGTFLITQDDALIARLNLTYSENSFHSSFVIDNNTTITKAIQSNLPLAFSIDSGEFTAHIFENSFQPLNDSTRSMYTNLTFTSFEVPDEYIPLAMTSEYNVSLDVDPLTSPNGTEEQLCWATCIAMVSNYRTGSSYDANDIYEALDNEYSGTPSGTNTWYERGFDYCGMSYEYDTSMNFTDLINALADERPVIFDIYPKWYSTSGHATVLSGINGSYTSAVYTFCDPTDGLVFIADIIDDFYYDAGKVYTDWRVSRY